MQFIDLQKQYLLYKDEIDDAIQSIITQANFVNGAEIDSLEQKIANYIGTSYAVSCNSGTDALKLSLMCLGLEPGDEVITTPFTFIATCEVIEELGLQTVFVDIDIDSFNLDVDKIEEKITSRTKAIIPVHLFGEMVDMKKLMSIAERHKLIVIEDCAQAFGSECNLGKAGSIGHFGAHSFFPTKNLGGYGDGGIITTNDKEKYEWIKAKKNHGQKVKYIHDDIGISSRLDTIQAAVLLVKLRYFEKEKKLRQEKYGYYLEKLGKTKGLRFQKNTYGNAANNMFNVVSDNRDSLKEYLGKNGVPTMIYYPIPMHLQKYFVDKYGYKPGDYTKAEELSKKILAIPFYPYIDKENMDITVKLFYDKI